VLIETQKSKSNSAQYPDNVATKKTNHKNEGNEVFQTFLNITSSTEMFRNSPQNAVVGPKMG